MSRPLLVQYRDIKREHFASHPVWVGVHGTDEAEPWYEDADEETFRPWLGALPVDPDEAMFLVRATFTFADATVMPGFLIPTPGPEPTNRVLAGIRRILDHQSSTERRMREMLQAEAFLPSGRREQFYDGLIARPDVRAAFLTELGKRSVDLFPVHVAAPPGLTTGRAAGTFDEF